LIASPNSAALPSRLTRIVPANTVTTTLGQIGAADDFVVDASQIKGLTTLEQIAKQLTLLMQMAN